MALKETLDLPVRSVAELLPEVSLDEEDEWIEQPTGHTVYYLHNEEERWLFKINREYADWRSEVSGKNGASICIRSRLKKGK